MPDYDAIVDDLAAAPAEVSTGAGTVKERPLAEILDAQRRTTANEAVTRKRRGIRYAAIDFPGTT